MTTGEALDAMVSLTRDISEAIKRVGISVSITRLSFSRWLRNVYVATNAADSVNAAITDKARTSRRRTDKFDGEITFQLIPGAESTMLSLLYSR